MVTRTAPAEPAKTLVLSKDNGCVAEPFEVKGGETYRFEHTMDQILILTLDPVIPGVIVKDPEGKQLTLDTFANSDEPGDTVNLTQIIRKGWYSITFPRAGKVEGLCVNAAG